MARRGPERYTAPERRTRGRSSNVPLVSKSDFRRDIRKQTERARHNMQKGMFIVIAFVLALSVMIFRALYQIAITEHREYSELAANTHTVQYPVYPTRGNILDADGKDLAISTYTYTIGVTPSVFGPRRGAEMSDAEAEEGFCKILDVDVYNFRRQLKEKEKAAYMVVRRTISAETNDKLTKFLRENRISGVRQDANQARYYPQNDLASTVIGFANKAEGSLNGVIGIEAYYNQELAGQAGYVYRQVDNYWSQELPNTSSADVPAVPGLDLRLTLQSDLQRFCQDLALKMADATLARNGAQLLVMEPQSGEILAMTGENNFNLNDPAGPPTGYQGTDWHPNSDKKQMDYMTGTIWTNRAINFPHEVGSVMKPFVLGMALDEAAISLTDQISDDFVYIKGWPYPISSYDGKSRGLLTPAEAIWDSRNPPFVRIAQKLGLKTFYDYIKALGLRDRTGVDLPYEKTGLIHKDLLELNMAVTAFGEQVTITSLQMANDYCMLANGGNLLKPRLADALLNSSGEVVKEYKTEVTRQVLSEDTCRSIRNIMVGVGRYGTAQRAYLPGVEAGFKTGTSSRAVDGSDKDNSFTLTAVCLLPADEPKYVIYSCVHDVSERYHKMAQVAARQVAEYLIERDNMPLHFKAYDYNFLFAKRYPDDYSGRDYMKAQYSVTHMGMIPVLSPGFGKEDLVATQYPLPGLNCAYNTRIWLSPKSGDYPEEYVTLPDFRGLTAEEALREAERLKLNIALTGSNRAGRVTEQTVYSPEIAGGSQAGEKVRLYSLISLAFDGEGAPGPYNDDSLTRGYDDGSGEIHW